jgi:hypothetical protein
MKVEIRGDSAVTTPRERAKHRQTTGAREDK